MAQRLPWINSNDGNSRKNVQKQTLKSGDSAECYKTGFTITCVGCWTGPGDPTDLMTAPVAKFMHIWNASFC